MQMRKGRLIAGLILILCPSLIQAKVMLVVSSNQPCYLEIVQGFKKNSALSFEEYNLSGLEDEARKLGKRLEGNKPDLLIAVGNLAAKVAKEYCDGCAVVYVAANNVRGIKLSGDKVSGISVHPPAAKIIEGIKTALPDRKRIGIIYNPLYTSKEITELQAAASKSGLSFQAISVTQIKDLPPSLNQLASQMDVYLMLDDPGVISPDTFPYIFMTCFQKKIPIFATSMDFIEKGAIAGFAPQPDQIVAELTAMSAQVLNQKYSSGKEKNAPAKLFINNKIAQMWNFNFPPQAKSQATLIQ